MRLVVENSDEDVEAQYALDDLTWNLRELTANLLRVTRGAGRPEVIGQQSASVVDGFQRYFDAKGHWPVGFDLAAVLDLNRTYSEEQLASRGDLQYAERDIVRAALQIAASDLLGQRTQATRGHSDMAEAIRSRDDALAAIRLKPPHANYLKVRAEMKKRASGLRSKGRPPEWTDLESD
ncbi:hypothetical protein ACFO0A_00655 [Novosphingobium tardum]|uniref:Uncharacterized protein n=1 Tax=Novosphingobium tardum TaxID=1538021 RepID=A0ABV8RMQ1_9SPHN